jgi:acetolactate synthase-1/3 small subunit
MQKQKNRKNYISLLVKNEPGVLATMAQAFHTHHINIISIACGQTEDENISRMIICPEDTEKKLDHVISEISNYSFVSKVENLIDDVFVERELVLIKVCITKETISQILQIFEVFRANVVDMSKQTISAELTAPAGKIQGLIKALEHHGIISICRTGTIALRIGDE